MEHTRVARLELANLRQYRDLMLEAYVLAADAFTSTAEDRASEPDSFWIRRMGSDSDSSAAFGAFDGQDLIGTATLEFSAKSKTRHKALVIGMYVTPSARGTGAGRALMNAIIEYARARTGIVMLTLTATEGNAPAIGLYESVGFQSFGIEPMAILTPLGLRGKVHMWMQLHPHASVFP